MTRRNKFKTNNNHQKHNQHSNHKNSNSQQRSSQSQQKQNGYGLFEKSNGMSESFRFSHNRSQSFPPVSNTPIIKGSDTCSYEKLSDSLADQLCQQQSLQDKFTYPMQNHGNTCFFNAVMQCLTHTTPLRQLMLNSTHTQQCQQKQSCYHCAYTHFIQDIKVSKRTAPLAIVRSLPKVWRSYQIGQQRDSHEFLTIYLEQLLNSHFAEKPTRTHVIKNQSQTPLFKIFGGKLRSQITCQQCNYKSDTFDETFTFNVPLPSQENCTFSEALKQFCSIDKLTKDNRYLCPVCKSKQNATKSLSINLAPRILVVTVKRFDIFGRKVTRKMRYPAQFNLKKHMDTAMDADLSEISDEVYDLYAVCVHSGYSTNSGHYYSYCKSSQDKWFECNDSHISSASEQEALNQEAYLLFYQKRIQNIKTKVTNQQPQLIVNSSSSTQISSSMETSESLTKTQVPKLEIVKPEIVVTPKLLSPIDSKKSQEKPLSNNFSLFQQTPLKKDSLLLEIEQVESIGEIKKIASRIAPLINIRRDLHPVQITQQSRKRRRSAFKSLSIMEEEYYLRKLVKK